MDLRLDGKTAVVCGSTQGIGKAIAMELSEQGANLIMVARNEDRLNQVCSGLQRKEGQVHQVLVADFNEPAILKAKINQLIESGVKVEILINNTGGPAQGDLIEEDYDKIDDTLQAHLRCNHLLAQAFVPTMREANYGRIINVISTSVYMPIPGLGVSNTVRGAVASWAKTLSIELAKDGITVNNVLPGLTKTARLDSLIKTRMTESGMPEKVVNQSLQSTIPAGRFGEAMEVANLAAFLASPAAAYINGTSIAVDGGKTGSI